MNTTITRYWPNGDYCPLGRHHLTRVTITTTAPRLAIDTWPGVEVTAPRTRCQCDGGWITTQPPSIKPLNINVTRHDTPT